MIQLKKIVPAAVLCLSLFTGCSQGSDRGSVKETVTYELGDKVTLTPDEFIIDASESELDNAEVTSKITDDAKFEFTGFTREVKTKGKSYLETGTYDVTVKFNGKEYPSKIVVEDTTPPEFVSSPQSIVVAVGDENFDPVKRFRIQDKDQFDVKMEGDYDLNTPGIYDVKIIATDKSGNKSSISITMKVVDGEQIISSEDQIDEDFNDINEAAENAESQEEDSSTTPDSDTDRPSADSGVTENTPDKKPSSGNTTDTTAPEKDPALEEQPEDDKNQSSGACTAGNVAPGSPYYYTFDEAYAAGTSWNQQASGNYFFYLLGTDDCGKTIYILTLGSESSSGEASSAAGQENAGTAQQSSETDTQNESDPAA